MEQQWENSFREKLNGHYTWPTRYPFKFIVPAGQQHEVYNLMPNAVFKENHSANGNYVSVSFESVVTDAEAVIDIYKKASQIKGVVAL
ncbi:MAG: DUF493 family protein [Cyclobacteriaceae bacterium]|jgi:putative lipoic acid-binding regulatory protein|nr:DUF493 family protein [Cytophagales bacterium]MCZ8328012.1 DUF493 family protein [Cyclobacteriaceae bacterium]